MSNNINITHHIQQIITQKLEQENGGVDKANENMDKLGKSTKKTSDNAKEGAGAFKSINFEFLGVMFFGQAVTKIFSEMLKPAAKVFGIQELWGLMLQDLFLPTMADLMPMFFNMMDFFMNLPDEVKRSIGEVAKFGTIAGSVLGQGGQLALGIQSLSLAFTGEVITKGAMIAVIKKGLPAIGAISLLVGLSLTLDSVLEDGIQAEQNMMAAIASGIGLTLLTGSSLVGGMYLTGASMLVTFGLDIAFDSVDEGTGGGWWKAMIGSILTGMGLGSLAGIVAGSLTVGAGVAVVTIPLTFLVVASLKVMWDVFQGDIPLPDFTGDREKNLFESLTSDGTQIQAPNVNRSLLFNQTPGFNQPNNNRFLPQNITNNFNMSINESELTRRIKSEVEKSLNETTGKKIGN